MCRTALELFLGDMVVDVEEVDGEIHFETFRGFRGCVVENYNGNLDIWVGEEVVYEMEAEIVPIIEETRDNQLFDLYEYIRGINPLALKYKSKMFVDIVQDSIKKLLIKGTLPVEGRTIIDSMEVIYTKTRKLLIMLN